VNLLAGFLDPLKADTPTAKVSCKISGTPISTHCEQRAQTK
jgi:hypothetical protein